MACVEHKETIVEKEVVYVYTIDYIISSGNADEISF